MVDQETKDLLPGEDYKLENGQVLFIKPVPFGKLPKFASAVSKLVSKVGNSEVVRNFDITTMFDLAFEEVVEIMMLVLSKERVWFDGISATDGIGIAELILRQNITEKTKKNLKQLVEVGSSLLSMRSKSL